MSFGLHSCKQITTNNKMVTRTIPEAMISDIELIKSFGITSPSLQIFVCGPRNFNETLTSDDKIKCKNIIKTNDVRVVIHGTYLDNPWKGKPGTVHNIKQELRIAHEIGANGVVIHLDTASNDDDNFKRAIESITNLPDEITSTVTLWLEINAAKSSQTTYETPQKIRARFDCIINKTINTHNMKIGLCVDTAHLFSCGLALDTYDKATTWLNQVSDSLGKNVPIMIHLNDSASSLGSGKDQHAALTKGNLWAGYGTILPIEDSGLMAIINWAVVNNTIVILERNYEDSVADLMLIHQLL